MLPDMTGTELQRSIAEHDDVADLPLVLYRPELPARMRYRFLVEPDLYSPAPVSLPRFCLQVCALSRPRGGRALAEVCEAAIHGSSHHDVAANGNGSGRYASAATAPMPSATSAARGVSPFGEAS